MANFSVIGPIDVPVTKGRASRAISPKDVKSFWLENAEVADFVGCYVFAFRASKGFKPIYIGKTVKSFKKEVFTGHKLAKYAQGLSEQRKGTPVLFFVCLERTRGPINEVAIDELETFLIQSGMVANPEILNDRKRKTEAWSVTGLVRSKGRPSKSASFFKKCLAL